MSQQQPKGFGSFHSEREDEKIDVLISLPDELYNPPQFPVVYDIKKYPYPVSPFQNISNALLSDTEIENTDAIGTIPYGKKMLSSWFQLDPSYCFINHGAFGATMRPVSESQILWQNHAESQPLRFIDRQLLPLLVYTTRRLAKFVNCPATDLVMIPNVTTGLNCILGSIDWEYTPGEYKQHTTDITTTRTDECISSHPSDTSSSSLSSSSSSSEPYTPTVLIYSTIYGATKQMLKHVQDMHPKITLRVHEMPVTYPVSSSQEIISLLKHTIRTYIKNKRLNEIKLVIIDYVQSNASLVYPIVELCQLCKQYNIPTLIDAAHGLGNGLLLDIAKIQPTFLVSNAHKWLCSGKGCAIMYISPEWHQYIRPPIPSHGYSSSTLAGKFTWSGLMDYSHYISVNTSLDAYNYIGYKHIQYYIHNMIKYITIYLVNIWNSEVIGSTENVPRLALRPTTPDNTDDNNDDIHNIKHYLNLEWDHDGLFGPMVCIRLPGHRVPQHGNEANELQDVLYYKYNIELPVKMLQNRLYVRISCHIYNEWSDYVYLAKSMLELRPALSLEDDKADLEAAQNAALVLPTTGCG